MTRRVLVTGAAGFIAGHLATALRSAGPTHITGADAQRTPAGRCDAVVTDDLLTQGAIRRLVAACRPHEVYHLIGAVRGTDADVVRSNVVSVQLLLDAVRATAPAATVVLVGSAAEYGAVPPSEQPVMESHRGAPVFAYGRAKQEVTALGEAAGHGGLRVLIARPFNVIGAGVPETLVAGALVRRLRDAQAGPPPWRVSVGDTTSVRDFVDALDVARGLVTLARAGSSGEAYNLCTGRGRPVADVVTQLVALAGGDIAVEGDAALSRAGEVSALVGSPGKAAALGWRAERPFEESLRAAWEAVAPAGVQS